MRSGRYGMYGGSRQTLGTPKGHVHKKLVLPGRLRLTLAAVYPK